MKAYLIPNLSKNNSYSYTLEAVDVLLKSGISIFMSNSLIVNFSKVESKITFDEEDKLIIDADIIICIGGDGTILNSAPLAAKYKKPLLGINCGNLGFMCTIEHNDIHLLKHLAKGEYEEKKRIMIDAVVTKSDGTKTTYTALNDIVISKPHHSKISDFEISKDGLLVSSVRADGLIFSTPTGSTAYSLSAGGPILEDEMECIEFTPICVHSLMSRSIVFSKNSKLIVKLFTNCDQTFGFSFDGILCDDLTKDDTITISMSDKYIKLIDIKGGSYFDAINNKLMKPIKAITGGN